MDRTSPDSLMAWNDRLLLGDPAIDADHQTFVELVGALQAASEDELPIRLQAFADHARAHFERENTWMTETGFSARQCHVDEHDAVLRSVDEVLELTRGGDRAVARRLADELARWFPGHLQLLDSALAHWLCKQRFGGKPVVLQRFAATRVAPQGTEGP